MGELGLNKIFGALLAVALTVMGLKEVSTLVFGGGHHGSHEYTSMNEWAESNFHGYRIDIAEIGGAGGDIVEEIYDLGLLLASADAAKGERSFKGKCASCHTVEQGGTNGTGPNLYATVGSAKQHIDGFNYSGALANVGGDWTYENLDEWLRAPSKYARGTNMAFAGLNRDDERANVIAYLASFTPNAPAYPEPLPEVAEDASIEGAALGDGVEDAALEAAEAGEAVVTDVVETVVDGGEAAVEAVAETAGDVVEAAGELAEDTGEVTVENVVDAATPEE